MSFQEILAEPLFLLPKQLSDKPYLDFLLDSLTIDYLSIVNSLPDGDINLPAWGPQTGKISGKFIKKFQNEFVQGLVDSVTNYLDGNPGLAYSAFVNTLDRYAQNFSKLMSVNSVQGPFNYYRIRTSSERFNMPFNRREMFHIPLSQRGKVQTQRFSISGFPSLYIADSLYVCWEELRRPHIDTVHAVRLETKSALRLFDLSPPPDDANHERVNYLYFMTWPLTMACSVQVKNQLDNFKPEYIIPQLLMQWIRQQNYFDGIRYKCNLLPRSLFKAKGALHNIILPIATGAYGQHEYCPSLTRKFKMTSTITWPAYKFTMEGFTTETSLMSAQTNSYENMPDIELIEGFNRPYNFSVLGKMQSVLDSLPASDFA